MTVLTFWTYIITNHKLGALYTGHTDNIGYRMEQHIHGEFEGFSQKYGLKHLVWFEPFGSRHEAFVRERQIKNWNRQWKLNLIEAFNPLWLDLHRVPYWPLPDPEAFPKQYDACLKHRVDPALRRDERRFRR
ncbi:MAG: GIY-YIG nuclease family protein [Hellea sp.]|nr:GIY-YIG nuclease family protein [Hellea sp.]